jgi:SAM-dependent methyltransferase
MLKKYYYKFIFPYERLHHAVFPFAIFLKSLINHISDLPRQLLTVDLIRFLICFPRYVLFYLILKRVKFAPNISDGVSKDTIEHNMRGVGELAAQRSHLLIRPIISIDQVARDIRNLRVLSIGPRVEGEIYNLIGYGFSKENVMGLDLFSYSPYIKVGDMHEMDFPDDYFDVVISGWVLGYSDKKQKAADEMLRITKPGGILAIGNAYSNLGREEVEGLVGRWIGSEEVISNLDSVERLFRSDNIFFRDDGSKKGVNGAPMITVLQKPFAVRGMA